LQHEHYAFSKSKNEVVGFLGLELPLSDARVLLEKFRKLRAKPFVVPIDYRHAPKISREEAEHIAQQDIKAQMQSPRFANVSFEPVRYIRETVMFWTFVAASEDLRRQGLIPGALFSSIDKLDGHVWQEHEFDEKLS
jgi:hypothetical protein